MDEQLQARRALRRKRETESGAGAQRRWGAHFKQLLRNKLIVHKQYIGRYGDDMPEIRDWKWPY